MLGFQGAHAHWPGVQGARSPFAAARVGHLLGVWRGCAQANQRSIDSIAPLPWRSVLGSRLLHFLQPGHNAQAILEARARRYAHLPAHDPAKVP